MSNQYLEGPRGLFGCDQEHVRARCGRSLWFEPDRLVPRAWEAPAPQSRLTQPVRNSASDIRSKVALKFS
jgi:hypothetical protein